MSRLQWKKEEWKETRFNVEMTDPYLGLEDAKNPDVLKWVQMQNEATDRFFEENIQGKQDIKNKLKQRNHAPLYSSITLQDNGYWAIRANEEGTRTIVFLDLNFTNEKELDTSYLPDNITLFSITNSPKEKNLAYLTGLEDGAGRPCVLVVDLEKKVLIEKLDGIFSSLWDRSGTQIYYSDVDVDAKSGRNVNYVRRYHCINHSKTTLLTYQENSVLISLSASHDGNWIVAEVKENYADSLLFMMEEGTDHFRAIHGGMHGAFTYLATWENQHYFKTQYQANLGKIITMDVNGTLDHATTFIEECDMKLEDGAISQNQLVLLYLNHASSIVRRICLDNQSQKDIVMPTPVGACQFINSNTASVSQFETLFLSFESFVVAPMILTLLGTQVETLYESGQNFSHEVEIAQIFANASDGEKIPAFLVYPVNLKKTGKTPTLMYGYGGYNNAVTPSYNNPFVDLDILDWVKQGRIYVSCNIRGGSEYGTRWHRGGNLENKRNCFTDFIAIAQKIQQDGWTCPEKTAICGGSNGGLLMCAVLTMRPDLWGCVIASVPHTDMIRFRNDDRGPMYITEYGDPMDEKFFPIMLSYSPYHNIQSIHYPAVYIQTGECDNNVPPYHGKKMAARLQECNQSENPILLRVLAKGSHDRGKGEVHFDTISEMQSFIDWALKEN